MVTKVLNHVIYNQARNHNFAKGGLDFKNEFFCLKIISISQGAESEHTCETPAY